MPLKATCSSCGKTFGVPDRFAGKRFKCKNCGEPVKAPELEADDDLFDDMDFGGGETVQEDLPPKSQKSGKSKKSKKSKKGGGSRIAVIAGASVAGFFALMVAVGVIVKLAPLLASMATPLSWQEYTTPDGVVTLQMPGAVKTVKVGMAAPGAQSLGVETRRFACVVVIEPIPAQVRDIPEAEMIDALSSAIGMTPGVSNVGGLTVAGKQGVQFDRVVGELHSEARAFKSGNNFYTVTFAYKGSPNTSVRDKLFNSVRVNETSGAMP